MPVSILVLTEVVHVLQGVAHAVLVFDCLDVAILCFPQWEVKTSKSLVWLFTVVHRPVRCVLTISEDGEVLRDHQRVIRVRHVVEAGAVVRNSAVAWPLLWLLSFGEVPRDTPLLLIVGVFISQWFNENCAVHDGLEAFSRKLRHINVHVVAKAFK